MKVNKKTKSDVIAIEFPWLLPYLEDPCEVKDFKVEHIDCDVLSLTPEYSAVVGVTSVATEYIFIFSKEGERMLEVGRETCEKKTYSFKRSFPWYETVMQPYTHSFRETVEDALNRVSNSDDRQVGYIVKIVKIIGHMTVYRLKKGYSLARQLDEKAAATRKMVSDGQVVC